MRELWFLLLDLARQMDIQVRLESLDGPESQSGGLCQVNGKKIIFIDKRLDQAAKQRILGLGLLKQDVEQFFMLPMVRRYLQQLEGESGQGN